MKATDKTRTDAALPMLLRSFKLPAFVRESDAKIIPSSSITPMQ